MQCIKAKEFTAPQAWGALNIATIGGASVRLHWTNEPYKWHANDGEEIFVVVDGVVNMFYKIDEKVHSTLLDVGDIFHVAIGTEHVAHPVGEARILIIEKEGSL